MTIDIIQTLTIVVALVLFILAGIIVVTSLALRRALQQQRMNTHFTAHHVEFTQPRRQPRRNYSHDHNNSSRPR